MKSIKNSIFLLYGVHGDETFYTEFICDCIFDLLSKNSLYGEKFNIYKIGPYSKNSSARNLHFSKNNSDPNRSHAKNIETLKIDLYSLIKARSVIHNLALGEAKNINDILSKFQAEGINLRSVLGNAQPIFKDFFGYVNEKIMIQEAKKRRIIIDKINNKTRYSEDLSINLMDVHAGIGNKGEIRIIHRTNSNLVKDKDCYLVDGLARDLNHKNANFSILEVGLKNTAQMFKCIVEELRLRSECTRGFKRESLLTPAEHKEWCKIVKENIRKSATLFLNEFGI